MNITEMQIAISYSQKILFDDVEWELHRISPTGNWLLERLISGMTHYAIAPPHRIEAKCEHCNGEGQICTGISPHYHDQPEYAFEPCYECNQTGWLAVDQLEDILKGI